MKKIFFLLLAFLGLYIFRSWFGLGHLAGFDLPYFSSERLKEFGWLPQAWDSAFGDGIGENTIKYLWVETYLRSVVSIFVNRINLPWELVLRLFWLWPYLALMIFSPYFFLKKILPDKNPLFLVTGVLVYSFNTYVLLLVSGGQMNLAIAYMLAPLVLWSFIRHTLTTGLVLAVQALFDLRMAYVTMIAVGIYFLININLTQNKTVEKDPSTSLGMTIQRILLFLAPLFIVTLLHFFWLLPQMMTKTASLPPGYDNPGWLSFLSWAPFSNAISLLHPNWPENIFGKVYFMRPEFLGIPILAYMSLLFLHRHSGERSDSRIRFWTSQNDERNIRQNDNHAISQYPNILISFFVFLGLLGAFLAKGVNGPFGEIYYWLFNNVPFFYLFRDPTKFYLLVAIAYMVLIPFSLTFLTDWINEKMHFNNSDTPNCHSRANGNLFKWILRSSRRMTGWVLVFLFLVYWFLLLWPVFSGQVKGTFLNEKIPDEYLKLEQLLSSDKKFSRTLWVPTTHRLSYITNSHPAIPAAKLLNTTDQDKILNLLKEASVSAKLQELAVGYVIIPYDFSSEIFLTERKYDKILRNTVKQEVDKLSYLSPITGFNNLTVYRLAGTKEHFYINNIKGLTNSRVNGLMINPTKYEVKVENAKRGDLLVFSERFDAGWKAKIVNNSPVILGSEATPESDSGQARMTKNEKISIKFNSFLLPKSGSYALEVYYEPQKYVVWGSYISLVTLALSLVVLLVLRIVKRRLT